MADSVEPDDVVDAEPSQALVRSEQAAPTLFNTDEPDEVIEKATKVANALKQVVVKQKLVVKIGGKEHPLVEAWQTLGGLVGVHAIPVGEPKVIPWPTPTPPTLKDQRERGLEYGFTASYLAVKRGESMGGGSARCTRGEQKWKNSDDYAIFSMAQTRAISKALSGPLRWVMKLAGYEPTPAEEMPAYDATAEVQEAEVVEPRKATEAEAQRAKARIEGLGLDVEATLKEAHIPEGKLENIDVANAGTLIALLDTREREIAEAREAAAAQEAAEAPTTGSTGEAATEAPA